jgi:hypothetical protein
MLTPRILLVCAGFTTLAACSQAAPSSPGNVLAGNIGTVDTLVASNGNLYFARLDAPSTNGWSIERVSESGGGIDDVVTNIPQPGGIAVDGTSVYWTDVVGGRLLAASLSTTDTTQTVIAANLSSPTDVVINDGAAYVTESKQLFESSLVRIPLDGGAQKTLASGLLQAAASDGTAIYFAQVNALSCTAAPCALSTIYRYATGDLAPTALFTSSEIVQSIAVRDGSVYALDEGTDATPLWDIEEMPIAGGAPTTIVSGLPGAEGLVTTPGSVYWTVRGVLWSAPALGGNESQVSSELVSTVVSDGSAVFAIGYTGEQGTVLFHE